MIFEVKYGIKLTMTRFSVDPLDAPTFTFFPGAGVVISYDARGSFHAGLTASHTGPRTFTVSRMAPGSYNVTQGVGTVVVGADGVLSFSYDIGAGPVDATLLASETE